MPDVVAEKMNTPLKNVAIHGDGRENEKRILPTPDRAAAGLCEIRIVVWHIKTSRKSSQCV